MRSVAPTCRCTCLATGESLNHAACFPPAAQKLSAHRTQSGNDDSGPRIKAPRSAGPDRVNDRHLATDNGGLYRPCRTVHLSDPLYMCTCLPENLFDLAHYFSCLLARVVLTVVSCRCLAGWRAKGLGSGPARKEHRGQVFRDRSTRYELSRAHCTFMPLCTAHHA